MYLGFVQLGSALPIPQQVKDPTTGVPKQADAAPTFRVYGQAAALDSGSLALKDPAAAGGAITAATNAAPIAITSANHGLKTGDQIFVSGVGGNTAANGLFTVTVTDASHFTLNGSTGNSAYTSGGTWWVAGLYATNYTPTGGAGFVAGQTYYVRVAWAVGGTSQVDVHSFTVV